MSELHTAITMRGKSNARHQYSISSTTPPCPAALLPITPCSGNKAPWWKGSTHSCGTQVATSCTTPAVVHHYTSIVDRTMTQEAEDRVDVVRSSSPPKKCQQQPYCYSVTPAATKGRVVPDAGSKWFEVDVTRQPQHSAGEGYPNHNHRPSKAGNDTTTFIALAQDVEEHASSGRYPNLGPNLIDATSLVAVIQRQVEVSVRKEVEQWTSKTNTTLIEMQTSILRVEAEFHEEMKANRE